MKAQHTPGPWYWLNGSLYDGSGRFIVSAFAEDGTEGMPPESPTAHYAPILKAAPDLLAALEGALCVVDNVLSETICDPYVRQVYRDGCAAIAKARGEGE